MAFAGLEEFNRGMSKLISNQPVNSLMDIPKIIGKAFLEQGKTRINENRGLMKKIRNFRQDMDNIGKMDVAKSMFYNRQGDLAYGRVAAAGGAGLATTGIAGSYIFGGDD